MATGGIADRVFLSGQELTKTGLSQASHIRR